MLTCEIIIPTLNRPGDLEIFFNSLLQQTRKPQKLTIVDAGEKSLDYSKYKSLFSENGVQLIIIFSEKGSAFQRNLAINQVTSDLVLFSDDDVVLESDYFERAIKVFEDDQDQSIGGITGKMLNYSFSGGKISLFIRRLFFLPFPSIGQVLKSGFACIVDYRVSSSIRVQWLSGCNMLCRREALVNRRFDENLKNYSYMEDVDLSFRISQDYELWYIDSARYSHFPSKSSRLKSEALFFMLTKHHHYLYKKNSKFISSTSYYHNLSLLGLLIQTLILKRDLKAFKGTVTALWQIIFSNE